MPTRRFVLASLVVLVVFGIMPAFAQASAPQVLGKATFTLPGKAGDLKIQKLMVNDEITLEATDAKGTKVWKSDVLGSEDKQFTLPDGKVSNLAVVDVTGDGVPELVTAAFYGPAASGLWVYTWKEKGFAAIPCKDSKEDSGRDFLVSDAQQEKGTDMLIEKNGMIKMLGRIYSENATDEPKIGVYFFPFKNGAFELEKTEALNAKGK